MPTVLVEATINLQGIKRGEERWVNSESPWVKENLKHGYLVKIGEGETAEAALAGAAPDSAADDTVEVEEEKEWS